MSGKLDRHARAHRRAHSDGADVLAFRCCRLDTNQRIHQGLEVLLELLSIERRLADDDMHIACLIGAIFDLACFYLRNCLLKT